MGCRSHNLGIVAGTCRKICWEKVLADHYCSAGRNEIVGNSWWQGRHSRVRCLWTPHWRHVIIISACGTADTGVQCQSQSPCVLRHPDGFNTFMAEHKSSVTFLQRPVELKEALNQNTSYFQFLVLRFTMPWVHVISHFHSLADCIAWCPGRLTS